MQAKLFQGSEQLIGRPLPIPPPLSFTVANTQGYTSFLSPTTAPVTGDLAGWMRPNDGSLLATPELPVKDDQLQRIPWGSASVKNSYDKVHTPWNDNMTSSYPHLPLPKDDGTSFGLQVSGFALHGDIEQCHTLDKGLKGEQGPSGPCVPFESLPACRSNPRRKRRRFTTGEQAVISYKRKMGVCGDCRQAKRKASLVMTSVFFC